MIYLGADHRGFELKNKIKTWLEVQGKTVEDVGALSYDSSDDFVDFAQTAGEKVIQSDDNRAILICRNGVGVDMAANRIAGVRSALGFHPEQVRLARNDDNVNVLSLAADFISEEQAQELIKFFLQTPFEAHERQVRRLNKLDKHL